MSLEIGTEKVIGSTLGPPVPVQCVSCPFRVGNDAEFAVIVNRIRKKHRLRPVKPTSRIVKEARANVKWDLFLNNTDKFACHASAYDENTNVRPASEHRQCAGAVELMKKVKGTPCPPAEESSTGNAR